MFRKGKNEGNVTYDQVIWSVDIMDSNEEDWYNFIIPCEYKEDAQKIALELLFASDLMISNDVKVKKIIVKRYINIPCMICKQKHSKDD